MKKYVAIAAALCGAFSLAAAPVIQQDGSFKYDNVRGQLAWFDGDWRMTGQDRESIAPSAGYPVVQPELFDLDGTMKLNNNAGSLKIQETIRLSADTMQYSARLTGKKGMPCRNAVLILALPVNAFGGKNLLADGHAITMSAANPSASYPELKNVKTLAIPMPDGSVMTLSGTLNGYIQDERNYGGDFFGIRLKGSAVKGEETAFAWNINFAGVKTGITTSTGTPKISPIDIRSAVNMSWRDEVPGDRKGGWTDQGENDVRDLTPGVQTFFDVPFDLIDPAENNGKSCMIFAGPDRGYMLKGATVDNINKKGERLYIFHGLSWAPTDIRKVADLKVTYTDGTVSNIAVDANRDVCNWWNRVRAENALIAWRGRNPQAETTLYLSGFDLDPSKTVRSISMTPTGNGVWMVAALSMGDSVAALRPQVRQQIVANKDWKAIDTTFEVAADSALDFSGLNHTPAGKYGQVIANGDSFAFSDKPGEPVRFYGVNLCWSAHELTHKESEILAERFARLGYNTVRIHHYDSMLTERAGNRLEFDKERLDKLDYLIAQMKKHGIYTSIDLYTTRVPAAEDVPGIKIRNMHDFRAALPIVPVVQENFKAFARKLLTHRNPYTGTEWRNEPAIFTICVVNENLLPAPWKEHPELPKLFRKAFAEWCDAQGVPFPPEFDDSPLFGKFVLSLQQKLYSDFSSFLKNELGVNTLLTDNNNGDAMSQTAERSMLDYADFHGYWEHPVFIEKPWQLPHYYTQESAVKREAAVPRMGMPCRILGKPYMVTEFDFGFPNHKRGEGGLLMGAYAGFQNWSGLYRFAYSHFNKSMFQPERCDMFDSARDPINLFADRIGALMFRRFDVTPAAGNIPFIYTADDFAGYAVYPTDYTKLGLVTGIGSLDASRAPLGENAPELAVTTAPAKNVEGVSSIVPADRSLWNNLANKGAVRLPKSGVYTSDNGQIVLDSVNGTLRVVTPRTEGFVLPAGKSGNGDLLSAKNGNTFVTCALTTPNESTLADADRMVLFVLTDVMNSGITFRDAENTILESYGTLPLLLRQGTLDISVKSGTESALNVYALDMAGNRIASIPVTEKDGAWHFTFNNNTVDKQPVFSYELERVR